MKNKTKDDICVHDKHGNKKNPRKRKDCPLCRKVDELAEIKPGDLKDEK